MKKFVQAAILLLALPVAKLSASTPHMYVYRAGGAFNSVDLCEGVSIRHRMTPQPAMEVFEGPSMRFSVPLSDVDSCVVRSVDIPTLHISLTDHPGVTQIWDKEQYLKASLTVDGGGMFDDADALAVNIKGRGNSTWMMPKKPYRLKFDKKTSVCGFKKAKSYVLLANFIDNSLMKNAVTLWLARELGIAYANSFVPCNVYLNGRYQGAYMMTEKVGMNSGSVDLDENSAILFEMSTEYDENYKFRSSRYNLPMMVKDPDFDELYQDNPEGPTPQERLEMWRQDFNAAEALAAAGRGAEAFDMDAFVDYYLLYNIACNSEIGHPKSVYLYKENTDAATLYKFGPPWDFDFCYNCLTPSSSTTSGYKERPATDPLWVNSLFAALRSTPEFKAAYPARLKHFKDEIYPRLLEFIDSYAALIEPSAKTNGQLWNGSSDFQGWCYYTPSFDTAANVAALRRWIERRVAFLETERY